MVTDKAATIDPSRCTLVANDSLVTVPVHKDDHTWAGKGARSVQHLRHADADDGSKYPQR